MSDVVQSLDEAFLDINHGLIELMAEAVKRPSIPVFESMDFIPDVDASPLLRITPLEDVVEQEDAYESLLELLPNRQQGMLRDAWRAIRECPAHDPENSDEPHRSV